MSSDKPPVVSVPYPCLCHILLTLALLEQAAPRVSPAEFLGARASHQGKRGRDAKVATGGLVLTEEPYPACGNICAVPTSLLQRGKNDTKLRVK